VIELFGRCIHQCWTIVLNKGVSISENPAPDYAVLVKRCDPMIQSQHGCLHSETNTFPYWYD
jgi:hypothetical protein